MSRAFTLLAASVLAEAIVSPAVLGRVFGIPTPSIDIQGDGAVTPATIARQASVGASTISAGAEVLATLIARAVNLPQAAGAAGATLSPSVISRMIALGQVALDTATNINVDAIDIDVVLPVASLHADSLVMPTPIMVAVTMPNSQVLIIRVIFMEGTGGLIATFGASGRTTFEGKGSGGS